MYKVFYRVYVTNCGQDGEDAITFESSIDIGNKKIPMEDIVSEFAMKKAEELYPTEEYIDHEIIKIEVINN